MARGRRDPRRAPASERLTGIHSVHEALLARRRELRRLCIRKGLDSPALRELADLARGAGVAVEEIDSETLAGARPGGSTQGVLLEAGPLPEEGLESLAAARTSPRTLVALDGVEDPQNLGAIARVAECAGVSGLILPRRRSAPVSAAAVRASAGALEWLPVSCVTNLGRALNQLKSKGFWIFGASPEGADDLFALGDRTLAGDRVLVLGGEGRGLRPGVERHVDHAIRIPMAGRVGSLNVSAAAAVLLYEIRRRTRVANPS